MLAHFGVDVLDPRTSLRRVRELSKRLPPGSWHEQDHPMAWTYEAYLLAQLIDEVAALNFTMMRAWGGKPPKPKPFPRPKAVTAPQRPQRKQRSSWAALADALIAEAGPSIEVHLGE